MFKNNIKTYLPYSSFHGAIIERFNQSIKNRIYNWMDQYKTEKYSPHLQDILIGYNNSYHSSIGVSPNVAWNNKSTHPQIREKLQTYFSKFSRKLPKLKIGDIYLLNFKHANVHLIRDLRFHLIYFIIIYPASLPPHIV